MPPGYEGSSSIFYLYPLPFLWNILKLSYLAIILQLQSGESCRKYSAFFHQTPLLLRCYQVSFLGWLVSLNPLENTLQTRSLQPLGRHSADLKANHPLTLQRSPPGPSPPPVPRPGRLQRLSQQHPFAFWSTVLFQKHLSHLVVLLQCPSSWQNNT